MKHTKKLLALVLAMVMVFSLMAVTAAAYGAEEHEHTHAEAIEPKGVAMQCEYCGRGMLQVHSYDPNMLAFQYTNVECKHCGEIFHYPKMG